MILSPARLLESAGAANSLSLRFWGQSPSGFDTTGRTSQRSEHWCDETLRPPSTLRYG